MGYIALEAWVDIINFDKVCLILCKTVLNL